MPRFFFNMSDGYVDTEGHTIDDALQLRALAIRTAAHVFGESPALWNGNPWQMKVVDEERKVALALELIARVTATD